MEILIGFNVRSNKHTFKPNQNKCYIYQVYRIDRHFFATSRILNINQVKTHVIFILWLLINLRIRTNNSMRSRKRLKFQTKVKQMPQNSIPLNESDFSVEMYVYLSTNFYCQRKFHRCCCQRNSDSHWRSKTNLNTLLIMAKSIESYIIYMYR